MPVIREDFGHSCFILVCGHPVACESGLTVGHPFLASRLSLLVIWIVVTPVPVGGLLTGIQLNEFPLLVVLCAIPLE